MAQKTKAARIFCPMVPGVDKHQLAMGVRVELEHTRSRASARCIALAHLQELPDYYTRLHRMEKGR